MKETMCPFGGRVCNDFCPLHNGRMCGFFHELRAIRTALERIADNLEQEDE